MTRPAISAAASAILDALPGENSFPTIGIIRRIAVTWTDVDADPATPRLITDIAMNVGISDREEFVSTMYGGGLAAEIISATQSGVAVSTFIGRRVKVELIDGQLISAYTVNGEN